MNEILLQTLVDKADKHDRQIEEMEEKIQNASDGMAIFKELKDDLELLGTKVDAIHFPTQQMKELEKRLDQAILTLKHPVTNTTIHHHHVHKIAFITAALFLLLCFVSVEWYSTYKKIDLYQSNDTKYRYLKIQGNKDLQQLLLQTDSIYKAYPDLRDTVIRQEELRFEQFQLRKDMELNEEKMKSLKQKIRN